MPEADDRQGRIDPGLAIEPVRAAQPEGADDLTIFLPAQVTRLPTYVIFNWLGWNGTWLPLIIPHCLANAFTVFLLRQYFMSIPRDLGEAAMIDGAGPFRILRTIIVPQSIAAVT
ncbi:MAG: ABC transporter permease subunit, partial [Candidatus Limnocylindrales bacterium]